MKVGIFLLATAALVGCKPSEPVEVTQVRVCIEDIRLGLDNPNTFELLSANPDPVEKGYRIRLTFNVTEGTRPPRKRVDVCGFKSATSTQLDPEDVSNQFRSAARGLKEALSR